ncbi:hypothetical protein ABZP36_007966 [Zizania latifolia]
MNVTHSCGGGDSLFCHFHPRELVVGVCAHCLRERLLILLPSKTSPADDPADRPLCGKTSIISLPKFEDNGKATCDSQLKAKTAAGDAPPAPVAKKIDIDKAATVTAVVEHVKRGGVTRWRKQVVGRLVQLARWKRSGKAGSAAACQLGLDGKKAAERSKGRGRSWIWSLTRRRAGGMVIS